MLPVLAHLTPLEPPVVWLAFAAGLVLGVAATWLVLRRPAAVRRSS